MTAVELPLFQRPALDLLKTALLGGDPITAEELHNAHYHPAPGVLDPVAVAARQQDPRYLSATLAVHDAITARRQRPIDAGAAALDILAQRAGIPLNISSFRSESDLYYPIAPGITYKTAALPSRVGGPGGVVEFIRTDDTPMMDWDTPGVFHDDRNVSVRHLGDVEELAREHLRAVPQSSLAIYQTPGGFRAWDLSQRLTPKEFAPQAQALKVDPGYVYLGQLSNDRHVEGLPIGQPGFSARISAKPGRPDDWVAQPLLVLRGKDSLPDRTSLDRIFTYHDDPINKAYLGGRGVSPTALEALIPQAATASSALRRTLQAARLLR